MSTLASVPVGVIQGVAEAVGRPDLILPLLAGVGDVDSAEPSYAMWTLSRLDPTGEQFREGFEQFLVDFGSRGPNEWESRSPTWETDPNLALVAIDRMRDAPESADPERTSAPGQRIGRGPQRHCWRWSRATPRRTVSWPRRSLARRPGCPAVSGRRPTTSV